MTVDGLRPVTLAEGNVAEVRPRNERHELFAMALEARLNATQSSS